MNTTLPLFRSGTKRARILPFSSAVRTAEERPVLVRSEGVCELNTVLHDVMSHLSTRYQNKFVSPISEGALLVRVSDHILDRVMTLLFEGMWAAGLWQDGEHNCVSPILCKCLGGFGALLELTDETMPLSRDLIIQLARRNAVRPPEIVGWQMLKARDLIEMHGGRLYAESPLSEEKMGTSVRLFLPLAACAIG